MMPRVDGFSIMNQLRGWLPDETYFPILVITADVSRSAKQKALSLGAKDFLTKPVDTAEAALRIYNLLETRWLHLRVEHENKVLRVQVKQDLDNAAVVLEKMVSPGESSPEQATAARQYISHAIAAIELLGQPDACLQDRLAESIGNDSGPPTAANSLQQ
jgi:CheY-like chemotaxis protein